MNYHVHSDKYESFEIETTEELLEKKVSVGSEGHVWKFPTFVIAHNRAEYYAERESSSFDHYKSLFKVEFDFAINDVYELREWFLNNMDWSDVSDLAVLVETPKILSEPKTIESVEVDY